MKINGQSEARKAVEANTTPRMLHLTRLRQYVDGSQYEGRPSWWDKSVPIWDREPCVVWHAADGAITSNEDLLLGEGRYPAVTTKPDEDQGDDTEALKEDPSEVLDRFAVAIEREALLRAHLRQAYRDGQSVGTCVGLFGVRMGRLFSESIQAEFVTATKTAEGAVESLEVRYPYVDLKRDERGEWHAKAFLFRRLIDANRDVTFLPAEAQPDGLEPKWQEDPSKAIAHGLGFCPVVYHKFRSVSTIVHEVDGHAVHEKLTDEIDAFNFEASMRHKGAMYSLPQRYETGVEPGYNPTGETSCDHPNLVATNDGKPYVPGANSIREQYKRPSQQIQGARKQGPDEVWQYDSAEVKVGQLELNDGSLQALADTMAELRARISETLAWVALNPEEIKFAAALSGKALERIMARQLNRVAKDRDGFGDGYLKPAYCMLLRIASKVGTGLRTRGAKKALPLLATFDQLSDGWADPPLSLRWGTWFQPVPEDDKLLIESVTAAYQGGFITRRTAVEKLSRTFGIENVDAYLDSLEEEAEEREAKEAKKLKESISMMQQDAHAASGIRAGRTNPKANAGSGSGSSAAVASGSAKSGPKPSGTQSKL